MASSAIAPGSTSLAQPTPITSNSFGRFLKRGVMGSFHKVSKKYLPLYLNEFTFRFNNRS